MIYEEMIEQIEETIEKIRRYPMPTGARAFFGFIFNRQWTEPEILAVTMDRTDAVESFFINPTTERLESSMNSWRHHLQNAIEWMIDELKLKAEEEESIVEFFEIAIESIPTLTNPTEVLTKMTAIEQMKIMEGLQNAYFEVFEKEAAERLMYDDEEYKELMAYSDESLLGHVNRSKNVVVG